MLVYIPFFKVIVISVNVFESSIIDKRHFSSRTEAESFANVRGWGISCYSSDVIAFIVQMIILVGAALFQGGICL